MKAADIQSTSDFRAIIEGLPVAILAVSQNGTIIFVNAQTELLFGWPRLELVGRAVEALLPERFRTQHPDLRRAFLSDPLARPMGQGRDLFGLRSDGTEFPLEIGLNPIFTNEGEFVLATVVDLTERKRSEQRLRDVNEALEASNLELQQFAYISSHDLQEPLRTVSGYAQLLQQEYGGELDDQADSYIRTIIDLLKHMRTLVEDLRSIARVEAQARPLNPVALDTVFEDSVRLLEASILESGARVTRDQLPIVLADAPQLEHLFTNLIGNAIKFVDGDAPVVHVSAQGSGDFWIVTVADNGIGIAEENFEKIFEVFRRVHTSAKYQGTGLGLALCRRIVHRHGGRIWVESVLGQGSHFRFTLHKPLEDTSAE